MSNQRKIEKEKKIILEWIKDIEKLEYEIQRESSDRKRQKLQKKLDYCKEMIDFSAQKIDKEGGTLEEVIDGFNDEHRKIIIESVPYGLKSERSKEEQKRVEIIERHKKKIGQIKEMQSKYPEYDINLSPKKKLENKIYKYEKSLGATLYDESNKGRALYKPEWNYLEHMETSKEFTEEEKAIMDRCYEVGKEYFAQGGGILDKLEDWGDITQAKVWCRGLYKDTYSKAVQALNPNKKYTSTELEREAKEMTKRSIEFILNEELHREPLKMWKELWSDNRLGQYSYEDKEDIIFKIMEENFGQEKTLFTYVLLDLEEKHIENTKQIGNYTWEELGLD